MLLKPKINKEYRDEPEEEIVEEDHDPWVLLGPDGNPYNEEQLYLWPWSSWVDEKLDPREWSHLQYATGVPKHYGPTEKQFCAWVEDTNEHEHELDMRIWCGSVRSGKSSSPRSRFIYLAYMYPGSKFIVGSMDFKYLLRSTIETDYKPLLSLPGKGDWSHPFVKRKADKYNQQLEFINGSIIYFANLSEENIDKLLGMSVDGFQFEQPELLNDFDGSLDTVITRMSGGKCPRRCVYITANPFKNIEALEYRFSLPEYDPEDLDGPQVFEIGKPCRCHLCNMCLLVKKKEVEWVDRRCPECGTHNRFTCSGRQMYQHAIYCRPEDNAHNVPPSFHSDMQDVMSEDTYAQLGKGKFKHAGKGKVYSHYSAKNLAGNDPVVKLDRDIYWCHDFNNHPMSSCMWQLDDPKTKDKHPDLTVFDEICMWGASAEKVAKRFLEKYGTIAKDFKGFIRLNGDPMGKTGQNMMENRWIQIKRILEKAGFRVIIDVKSTWYRITDRVLTTNFFLQDGDGRCRVKINPRTCPHLIKGLDMVIWGPTGTKEDEKGDRKARESKEYHRVWAMTHMPASFSYSLHRHFPAVEQGSNAIIINPEKGTVTEFENGEAVHRSLTPEEIREYSGVGEAMEGRSYDFASLEDWENYGRRGGRSQGFGDELRATGLRLPKKPEKAG